ncbi:hypothetical protein GCM10017786_43410 [Amycolatopsis deserti]|uniref:Uncharacterized protein n=1 Tax=Amycolatopsis deserti TaxID=185696 RepID=A0ABQ3J742_9PSEU|nr:hypothetical protein [Amycolatopsis deserti]GHF05257.1 hypothetical protein GCM10017786_43410 [Amycolatopsis deserti]
MRNELMFDAVMAEVAYRREQLEKAGRPGGRWFRRARSKAEIRVPEQRRASTVELVQAR